MSQEPLNELCAWLSLSHFAICPEENMYRGGRRSKVNEQIGRTGLNPTCSLEPGSVEHQEIWRFLNNKMYVCAISQ